MEQSQTAASPHVGPTVHRVKEQPSYFEDLIRFPRGRPYELRENDRDYKTGDGLRVVEWDPDANAGAGAETGRWALLRIAWTSDDWARVTLLRVALERSVVLLGVELLDLGDAADSLAARCEYGCVIPRVPVCNEPGAALDLLFDSPPRPLCARHARESREARIADELRGGHHVADGPVPPYSTAGDVS